MKKLTLVSSALVGGLLLAGPATAQTGTSPAGATKMSQAECDSHWNRLDASKSGSVAQAQASASVSDFKKADINNDGKLSRTEFQQACSTGLVRGSATTGAGAGTGGAAKTPAPSPSPSPQK